MWVIRFSPLSASLITALTTYLRKVGKSPTLPIVPSEQIIKDLFPNCKTQVFSCLGPAYGNLHWTKRIKLMIHIWRCDSIYSVSIGEKNKVMELSKEQFVKLMKDRKQEMNSLSYVMVKNV